MEKMFSSRSSAVVSLGVGFCLLCFFVFCFGGGLVFVYPCESCLVYVCFCIAFCLVGFGLSK